MKVFYNSKQSTYKNINSISPSAQKPDLVINSWLSNQLPVEIVDKFKPAAKEDLYLAHDRSYVDDVLACRRNNGFGNKIAPVNNTLQWTTGSLLAASEFSLKNNQHSCSPTSGFHHAGYCGFEGFGYFCTFNGLIVAASLLKQNNQIKKIGIIDLDHHDGNGTRDIIDTLSIDYIEHYTFGGRHNRPSPGYPDNYQWKGGPFAEKWLNNLTKELEKFNDCDLILYQAGADPHKDDPYGGALTNDQLRRRDEIVFSKFTAQGIPVVWNFAGGYQTPVKKVVDIHTNTALECLKAIRNEKR